MNDKISDLMEDYIQNENKIRFIKHQTKHTEKSIEEYKRKLAECENFKKESNLKIEKININLKKIGSQIREAFLKEGVE